MPPARALDDVLLRVQQVALDHVAPHAASVDADARWPERQLRALLDAGLGGLVLPERAGGLGLGLLGLLRVCETLGQHCASTAMCFGMHGVGSAVLAAKATPDQVERRLRPIAEGRHLTTLAFSEPGSGAHFYLPQTRLTRDAGTFLVDGTKSFVTNGGHADSYVINGVSDDDRDAMLGQFSCLVVDARAEGISWKEEWRGTGMRGNSSRTMRLDDVRVPDDDLLGAEGDQAWYVFHVVAPFFLSAMAGTYLGIAQAALGEAATHLKARTHRHTGQTLAQSTVLQHRMGELWAEVERARRLSYHAAEQGDIGGPDALPAVLSSKAEAGETAVRVTNAAMTLMGGIGYAQGGRLDRLLRDARAAPVMAPTTDILRLWTGRWLLGEPLLSG